MTQLPDVAIPSEFGGSLSAFVDEWCLGGRLGHDAGEVSQALSTLNRLWPDKVKRLVRESPRGLGIAASAVELGLLLDGCEAAEGVPNVLRRLVGGERSAYSELVVGAALRRLGHEPRFAAPIDGRLLDAACDIDSSPVYFEVVAPERSDASAEDQQRVNELTAEVRRSVSKCRVEIEIRGQLDDTSVGTIVAMVKSAQTSEWSLISSVARIRRIDAGQTLLPTFDGHGAQVVIAEERAVQGDSTSVIARWEASDARAKRIFNDEYHHFSKSVANTLVLNVCAVSDGMKLWPTEMARLLQPTRNRKVGAVVFFEQGSLGPPEAIRRRWRVLVNPYAYLSVPDRLLTGLESLDESEAYGLERAERVIAG